MTVCKACKDMTKETNPTKIEILVNDNSIVNKTVEICDKCRVKLETELPTIFDQELD